MKICVTSQGDKLNSKVDGRFGRCEFFIIWDSIAKNFVAINNPNVDVGSGAGIQSAQLIVEQHVDKVITGDVGPKAKNVLCSANIDIVTALDSNKTIQEVLNLNSLDLTSLNMLDENDKNQANNVDNDFIINKPLPFSNNVLIRCWNKFFGRSLSSKNVNAVRSKMRKSNTKKKLHVNSKNSCNFKRSGRFGFNCRRRNIATNNIVRSDLDFENNSLCLDNCVCPLCGTVQSHQSGLPCRNMNCPKCGATMMRG